MLAGLTTNKISFRFDKFFILGFLFCAVFALNAFGQEERTVYHGDVPADFDEINGLSGTDFTSMGKESSESKENVVTFPKKENKDNLHKQRGEKEARKEGMSTLSFNLFLYVIDRFKEDN